MDSRKINGFSQSVEQLLNEASEHILAHHVSLGDSPGDPTRISPSPSGSGTFVKFSIKHNLTIYGILTAAHVARWLGFGRYNQHQFLGLSKLLKDVTIACSVSFPFIYHIAPPEEFHSQSDDAYRPDTAFIALGINDRLPNHELISNSFFFDLDSNQELPLSDNQIFSGFCKGAGTPRPDGLLNTFVALGGGEILKFDEKANIQYWQVPNTSRESIAGGSGAGFWRFILDGDVLRKSLEGVITSESRNCDYFEVMEPSYIYYRFLPLLKKFCEDNFFWFD